jgi:hypothetical protein
MANNRKLSKLVAAATGTRPRRIGGLRRDHAERMSKARTCQYGDCGKTFHPQRHWQKFCSTRCRFRAWDADNPRVRVRAAR